MNSLKQYNVQSLFGGWTRIDMLLAIYDRSITAIQAADLAKQSGNDALLVTKVIEAQKCVLAIHGGLKPDEYDIAFDIARVLNFVLQLIETREFEQAAKLLNQLRGGFAAIREEAIQLERDGRIPPLEPVCGLDATV